MCYLGQTTLLAKWKEAVSQGQGCNNLADLTRNSLSVESLPHLELLSPDEIS